MIYEGSTCPICGKVQAIESDYANLKLWDMTTQETNDYIAFFCWGHPDKGAAVSDETGTKDE